MKEIAISVQGLNLVLCEWGDSTNQTILILHGWLDQAASWEQVALGLVVKGFHVLALDHRGHGLSSHIPDFCDYHFPDYISDLQELIRILKLKDFILVGHSMGGTIASIYSALCPQRPQQLFLVDGVGTRHETEEKATSRYQIHLTQRYQRKEHRIMKDRAVAMRKLQANHPYLSDDVARLLVERITVNKEEGVVWTWDVRHRNRSAIGFHLPRFLAILGQIQIPVTLIFGGQSWYVQLPDLPQRIKAIPQLQGEIRLPTGHSPHLEAPELLVEAIYHGLLQGA